MRDRCPSSAWNYAIRELSKKRKVQEALQTFHQMQAEGCFPTETTYVCLLSAFTVPENIGAAKRTHTYLTVTSLHLNIVVGTALINTYVKCGHFLSARQIFDDMPVRNVITWTVMVNALGETVVPLNVLDQMLFDGVFPNHVTYLRFFSTCASLDYGKKLHTMLISNDVDMNESLTGSVLNMYGRFGTPGDALHVFDKYADLRNVVIWTTIVKVFLDAQHIAQALQMYENMLQEGYLPNTLTLTTLLFACTEDAHGLVGKHIHAIVSETGLSSDGFMKTALISMYGRCRKLESALGVFDAMHHCASESWNATLSACAICNESCKVLQLYYQMLCECVLPSKLSLLTVLSACGNLSAEGEGKKLHANFIFDNSQNVEVQNALVRMYTKFGNIDEAERLYKGITCQSRVSWNTLIAMYVEHGRNECAFQALVQMLREHIIPDKSTLTSTLTACASESGLTDGSLIHAWIVEENLNGDDALTAALLDMYGNCGCVDDAWAVFQGEVNHDTVIWSLIIAAYAKHGKGWQVISLLEKMQLEGIPPNSITFIHVIIACSHGGLVNEGILYFMSMIYDYGMEPSDDHMACMINLFGKAGRMDEAECLLYGLQHDAMVVSLVSLISAYKCQHDVEEGEKAAKILIEVDPTNTAPYVLLSNLYISKEMTILEPD